MEKKINDFIIFCMEMYKAKKGLNGKEVYEIFENYKVFDYLQEGYDVLHTQGDGWIINDIDEFLKIRGYEVWFFEIKILIKKSKTQTIFKTGELEENQTTQKIRVFKNEGVRKVSREITFYSLDAIIAVGYRVN